jgi:hypothetical protein
VKLSSRRGARSIGCAAVAIWGLLSPAWAETPAERGTSKGRIFVSDVPIQGPPNSLDSVAEVVATLNKLRLQQEIAGCCDGSWRIHFAALLDHPAGGDTLVLAFQDRDGAHGKDLFSTQIPVTPKQTFILMNDFVISRELGFRAGHTYGVTLSRLRGSDILARGDFSLTD